MKQGSLLIKNEFEGGQKGAHVFVTVQIRDHRGVCVASATVDAGDFQRALAKPSAPVDAAIEVL